jgi:hypothetical protein
MATAVGVFLGLIGPFGTYTNAGGVVLRIAFWTSIFWLGTIIFGFIVRPAAVLGSKLGFSRLFSALAAAIVACAPVAAVVALIGRQLWPGARVQGALTWYGETLLVSLPLVLAWSRWEGPRRRTARDPIAGAQAIVSDTDFLARMPAHLGRELLCLQMEDHYVRAHTPTGSALVLIPLKQAIAELAGVEGLKVHRSWWVARAAVERALNDGRNLKLRLHNGLEVPVARTSVAEVRAAGWLG